MSLIEEKSYLMRGGLMLLRRSEGWAMAWRQIMVGAGGNYGIDREDGYRNSMGYIAVEGIKRRRELLR